MLLSEAFEAFEIDELIGEDRSQSTIEKYHDCRNSLTTAIHEDIHVELLMYTHIIAWKKFMHDRGNSLVYTCQQLRELRRVLTYLKDHGFSSLDPSEVKIPKGAKSAKTAWLEEDEIRRFLQVIDNPRDLALYSMMFCSGARISELLQLDRDSIRGNCAWTRGKGDKRQESVLHFDDRALIHLERYLKMRDDSLPALFVSRNHGRITVKTAIYNFHKYIDRAGIQLNGRGATHVLRHSFGTQLEINGLDIHGIAMQMRHKKIETTKIYLHGREKRKLSDYQRYHTNTPI